MRRRAVGNGSPAKDLARCRGASPARDCGGAAAGQGHVSGPGSAAHLLSGPQKAYSTGSFAFFLKPALAPIIAVIILRETILWNTIAGIVIILIASYMNIRFQQGKKLKKEEK